MLKKIVVPLDGSKLAECVLPYVEELASKCVVEEVVLISVTERIQGFRAIRDLDIPIEERLAPEAVGKMERQAMKYLDRIAKGLEGKGVKVTKEVPMGDPAQEIVIYAEINGCDLIVMASHGRNGPSRWLHGSVADKVFKAVHVPVMMIRAPGCKVIE